MSKYICEHFLICPRKKTCYHASIHKVVQGDRGYPFAHSLVSEDPFEVCTQDTCPLLGLDSICLKVDIEYEEEL
jgi:hypothetical protein